MWRKLVLALIISLSLTGLAWASAYSAAVVADGPLSYFQFEDGLSTDGAPCADSMGLVNAVYRRRGTGQHISLGASIPTLGYAAVFYGANGGDGTFIDIQDNGYTGDVLTNTSLTIEMLMKTTADSSNYPTVIDYHDFSDGLRLSFGNYPGPPVQTFQPFVAMAGSTWYAWPPGILGDGNWHHYAVTFAYDVGANETTAEIFMDLQSKGAHVFAGPIVANATEIWKDVLIGAAGNQYYAYNGYEGLLDEVAIYDYALTANQLSAHYILIPEPATLVLLGLGGLLLRRKKH